MAKAPTPKTGDAGTVVSLKVTLKGTKPPIWRRILVPEVITLRRLHVAIQAAMGWHGGHLYIFVIDGEEYGDPEMLDGGASDSRKTLRALMKSGVSRFHYTYDFGDNWEHLVLIEKTLPGRAGETYPQCTGGKRHCPPEDCGGTWGYRDLLEVLADPARPDREEKLEWLGEDFDPEVFDIDAANEALAGRFGRP